MAIKEESGIRFQFPDSAITIKFDDDAFFRTKFDKLKGAKGVDFLSVSDNALVLLEVKNCAGNEAENNWRIHPNDKKVTTSPTTVDTANRHSLDIEIPQKVAMSLACLSGALSYASDGAQAETLSALSRLIYDGKHLYRENFQVFVILFLEGDFGSHTRNKTMIMRELENSMRKKLKWLNCRVSIVDSHTYRKNFFEIL